MVAGYYGNWFLGEKCVSAISQNICRTAYISELIIWFQLAKRLLYAMSGAVCLQHSMKHLNIEKMFKRFIALSI